MEVIFSSEISKCHAARVCVDVLPCGRWPHVGLRCGECQIVPVQKNYKINVFLFVFGKATLLVCCFFFSSYLEVLAKYVAVVNFGGYDSLTSE